MRMGQVASTLMAEGLVSGLPFHLGKDEAWVSFNLLPLTQCKNYRAKTGESVICHLKKTFFLHKYSKNLYTMFEL